MLKRLSISNYALISSIEITFGEGLTIITGETGAGKSIMMGALSLLLGGRADTRVVRDKTAKSVVEATFSANSRLQPLFEASQLDWDEDEIIIRREVSATGRSRAFVNDTPVNLKMLGDITSSLIDIHSQNSNLMLRDAHRQLEILDALADNDELLAEYKTAFRKYVKVRNALQNARNEIASNRENENFLRFQVSQLDTLAPKAGELEALERQSEMLGDAEEIAANLSAATQLLDTGDNSIIAKLAEVRHTLSKVNFRLLEGQGADSSLLQRLESVYIEAKDIAQTLLAMAERVDSNPALLATVEQRMTEIYDALKRYNAADDAQLVKIHQSLKQQLDTLDTSDADLHELESEMKEKGRKLRAAADCLSETRMRTAEKFSELLTQTARPLGMSNLKFAALTSKGKLTPDGQDNVEFLCSFNKNQELMPVSAIASGGETSRLMLSIKAIIASHVALPSIIFDEVDTGVSGDVADKMGAMMRNMGRQIQVIAITHLPQVAAKGQQHYKVFKADDEEKTVTSIAALDYDQRVAELAVMLSGSSVDPAAVMNAKSLLDKSNTK